MGEEMSRRIVTEDADLQKDVNIELVPSADAGKPASNIRKKLEMAPGSSIVLPAVLSPPYAYGLDGASGLLNDFHAFDPETPLVLVKSSFSNVLEAFVADYKAQVLALFQAADAIAKKLATGKKAMISAEYAEMCRGRADMRLEEGQQRLMKWDGIGELAVQLPYAVIAQSGDESNPIIDFQHSRIRVNGMIWVCSYRTDIEALRRVRG